MNRIIFCCFLCLAWGKSGFSQQSVDFWVAGIPELAQQTLAIRGNVSPLSWDKSLPMAQQAEGYFLRLSFPDTVREVEFKFVYLGADSAVVWENTQNRSLSFSPSGLLTSRNQWNVEQMIDIRALPLLQPQELLADYALLETMVLQVHPGTYRYQDSASIRAVLAELKAYFQEARTHGEAYLAMSKVTAAIQCDHTKVGFNNQNKTINSIIHRQADKLPFTFQWMDGKMRVEYDATEEEKLPRATEILRINGVPAQEIRQAMLPYIGADGATDQTRLTKMEIDGFDFRYHPFDVFFPLLYPLKAETMELEVKAFGQDQVQRLNVVPLSREARSERLVNRYQDFPATRDDMWSFEVMDDSIGRLTINSFGLFGWKRMSIDYRAFLADVFARLETENISHLILDIRKNQGGVDEMKEVLFSYFPLPNRKIVPREGRTRYQNFPESLKPHIQTWGDDPWYYALEADLDTDGYYHFPEKNPTQSFLPTKPNPFSGKVYLLTSPNNTSLAYYLARDFQLNEMGTIIGEETGGNLRDINGGQLLFLRLPNSGIEIDSPVRGNFTLAPQPNQGVQPDVLIVPTAKDLYERNDPALQAALRLIRR